MSNRLQQFDPMLPQVGDGVTACGQKSASGSAHINAVRAFLAKYVTFTESGHSLVIALWLAASHAWTSFDAFPYLVVTSATKRSGKTRLLELMSFLAHKARSVAHISPAAMFHTINSDKPTLLVDEAEAFSSPQSEFRPLLNTGYRRGQKVLRQSAGATVEYDTYCPKVLALIGDVYDTLRDRSVVLTLRRGAAQERFLFVAAQQEGFSLRERLHEIVDAKSAELYETLVSFEGLPFLTDRDEEIWTPLFIMARLLCQEVEEELTRIAVDMATAKTADSKKYRELASQEKEAEEQEYAERLLLDVTGIIGDRKHITTAELIPLLRAIPTSPWRKFRGAGLKDGIDGAMDIAALLSRFGVCPKTLRVAPKGEKNSTAKGYDRESLVRAAEQAGLLGRNPVTTPCATAYSTTDDDIQEHDDKASRNESTTASNLHSPLVFGKRYEARPVNDGYGVFEIGSDVCLQWYGDDMDAWDAIIAVTVLAPESEMQKLLSEI